jgi:hypothetical protein
MVELLGNLGCGIIKMKLRVWFGLVVCCVVGIDGALAIGNRKWFYVWQNVDGTCMNQRHWLLKETSQVPVKFKTDAKCSVLSGRWEDSYTDAQYDRSADINIDHILSLSYAKRHGARAWTDAERKVFGNDPDNLAISGSKDNQLKSDLSPDKWMPANSQKGCWYVAQWWFVAKKYNLEIEPAIWQSIIKKLQTCTPGETRTPDHLVRSQGLYPTELRAQ